jgi:hypothetical protein
VGVQVKSPEILWGISREEILGEGFKGYLVVLMGGIGGVSLKRKVAEVVGMEVDNWMSKRCVRKVSLGAHCLRFLQRTVREVQW